MILIRLRTERRKDGRVCRRLFVRVTGESIGPLDVIPGRVPECPRGFARTGVRVRTNRSGTWAVWAAVDVRRA